MVIELTGVPFKPWYERLPIGNHDERVVRTDVWDTRHIRPGRKKVKKCDLFDWISSFSVL